MAEWAWPQDSQSHKAPRLYLLAALMHFPVWWLVAQCFQLSDVVAKKTWTSLFKGCSHSWTHKEKVRLRVKDTEFGESYNLSAEELMLSNCGAG